MIALDRIAEHQFQPQGAKDVSDYLVYEDNAYSDAWTTADPTYYNEQDWHDAVLFWVYDDEDIFALEYSTGNPSADYLGGIYEHYALMLKPYTPYNREIANGKYKILDGKKTVAGQTCTVYRYSPSRHLS